MALEIQTQMNLHRHSTLILAGANEMDFDSGYVVVNGTTTLEPLIEQFRVTYLRTRNIFIFQNVDDTETPVSSTPFALHVMLPSGVGTYRVQTDDLFDNLGMNRDDWAENGVFDSGSNTYYIINTTDDPVFGDMTGGLDARYEFSLHSNQSSDLRGGNLAVVLDIDPFNDNSIAQFDDQGEGEFNLGDFFGVVLTRDPAFVNDRISEVNSNSYPIKQVYKEGRSRVKDIAVTMRRLDGSVMDYHGVNFYLSLRLTLSRTSLERPMFARG
jgi:hypothetical protein